MIDPKIELLVLSNGDAGLFVNGKPVFTLDANDEAGETPAEVGEALATVFSVEMLEHKLNVPADREWTWSEVYASLPSATSAITTYLENGAVHCPYCHSSHISSASVEADGRVGVAAVTCNACGRDWNDLWEVTGCELDT